MLPSIASGILMSLSDRQIDLIQSSFARVAPIQEDAARYFYARLFEIAPEVRSMFRADIVEQGHKLMAMLGGVVRGLRDMPALLRVAGQLAERHVAYGVQPEHYPPVGRALIDTMEGALGSEFTPETRAAWVAAYGALSGAMIATAYRTAA
jgi:nitric oxide dioxygenase